jgi:outer membrane receptor protein involved in Fe transport
MGGRVQTNLNARFRDEFSRVEATGETMTVDGARYAVYGPITYDASIDANLSLQAEIARTQFGTTTLDLRVNNLFDTIRNNNSTSTSQPYQLGRNLWVSLKYKY